MKLKLIFPIPKELIRHEELGLPIYAACIEKQGLTLSESERQELVVFEEKIQGFNESIEKYSHDNASSAHYDARDALRNNPSRENEEAFKQVIDRRMVQQNYSRLRSEAFKAGEIYTKKFVRPVVLPILKRAIKAIEADIKEMKRSEEEIYKSYRLPLEVTLTPQGMPKKEIPEGPVIKALKASVINLQRQIEELELGITIGPVPPSNLLTGIVLIWELVKQISPPVVENARGA